MYADFTCSHQQERRLTAPYGIHILSLWLSSVLVKEQTMPSVAALLLDADLLYGFIHETLALVRVVVTYNCYLKVQFENR